MHNVPPANLRSFDSLIEIMRILRSPTGCPWDQEQTGKSIASNAIEEACELAEAIETHDEENYIEELGDVLLQPIFHAQIATEEKKFDILDVIERLNQKLVSRHPHVFSDKSVHSAQEALKSWSDVKEKEKASRKILSKNKAGFDIPTYLPALARADKIGKKTKKLHFDWHDAKSAFEHVENEILEFKEAMAENNHEHLCEEFGDVLFTLVQVARHLNIDAEQALRGTNQKVEKRWIGMQELAKEKGLIFEDLLQPELEELWNEFKKSKERFYKNAPQKP